MSRVWCISPTPHRRWGKSQCTTLATQPVRRGSTEANATTFQPVPLEASNGQKIVRAQMEGSQGSVDLRMIVDTGAQKTMIAPELADELGVRTRRDEMMAGATGVAAMSIVELELVRIGTEELHNVEVVVGSMPGLSLLGMDVLSRLDLRVGRDTLDRESR